MDKNKKPLQRLKQSPLSGAQPPFSSNFQISKSTSRSESFPSLISEQQASVRPEFNMLPNQILHSPELLALRYLSYYAA